MQRLQPIAAVRPEEEEPVGRITSHPKLRQADIQAMVLWGVQASKLVIDTKDLIFGHFDRDDRPTIS